MMPMMHVRLRRFIDSEDGATAVEYALLASIIAVAIVSSLKLVRTAVNGNLNSVSSGFQSVGQ